jgi:hypothetical protein
MSNKQTVFADRVVGISVHNGLVRLDLGVIAGATKNKDGKPALKLDATHQVVLPLEGFVAGVDMQAKLVKELVSREKKRREAKGDKAAEAPKA